MKIHHLNCATMCPPSALLVNGRGGLFERGKMVCHCMLIETEAGLVLVDSGLGTVDLADPLHLGKAFLAATKPAFSHAETAIAQVAALGFDPRDVRHVIVTHLDLDHAGGLPDFPHADVHVLELERSAATLRATLPEKNRYRPKHFAHGPKWQSYDVQGEPWFGFACVRELKGLPPEILMVPLIGHTRGHAAIAVDSGAGWHVHAGDAYFFHGEMDFDNPHCTPGLRAFQRLVAIDNNMRMYNQRRLRELVHDRGSEVRVFSAHDPVELERFN